jgi:carbonic anhydrase/acetyltransferase-like protein (isoleucine patch superfamily)
LPIITFNRKSPGVPADAFIAPNATLIGDVILGSKASVWFGAVLRAESAFVKIGRNSNIQDNCVLHTDEGFPVEISDGVSVGHSAVVHGARIGSNVLIGMGAVLLNGASIGDNSIVGASSLVTQGAEMPPGMLVIGSPAVAKRKLTEEEIGRVRRNSESYDRFREEYLKLRLQ